MYRAPEISDEYMNMPVGPQQDVWALGCVLFYLCYRVHPFEDSAKLRIINAKYSIPVGDETYTMFVPLIRKLPFSIEDETCQSRVSALIRWTGQQLLIWSSGQRLLLPPWISPRAKLFPVWQSSTLRATEWPLREKAPLVLFDKRSLLSILSLPSPPRPPPMFQPCLGHSKDKD